MKIFYLPLEPYKERYTELLTDWTINRWKGQPDVELVTVLGERLSFVKSITTGTVLDAHGRVHWSGTQVAALAAALYTQGATSEDVIYFDDMFTPGYEGVPYILDQLPVRERPMVFARNHAQSMDPDDFVFPMRKWMRHFEQIVSATAAGIICASTVHKEMMQTAMVDTAPIHVVGLPYDARAVRNLAGLADGQSEPQLFDRPLRVIYSSRFDAEKQPHFFMDVVEEVKKHANIEFCLCTGSSEVRSNDKTALRRLARMEEERAVHVYRNCSKRDYYAILMTARAQLNTARQDFISYTAIEASTFGTPTLAPAFRSFPECLQNRPDWLFVPWSVKDAAEKLLQLVLHPKQDSKVYDLSADQHRTLDEILDLFRAYT